MSDILVTTDKQILRITEAPRIAAEGVNENYVVITFDESWNGYGKTVLFYRKENDTTRYISVVDGNGRALVPNAVTQTEGVFCFSITGVKDNVEYTSEIVKYQVFPGMNATRSGSTPSPSPDVYTQIITALGALEDDLAAEVTAREDADTALAGDIDALANDSPVKTAANGLSVGIGVTPTVDKTFTVKSDWAVSMGSVDLTSLTVGGDPVFVTTKFSGTAATLAAGTAGTQNVSITTPSGYRPVMVTYLSDGNIVPGYCESWSLTIASVYYTNLHTESLTFTPCVYVLFAKV